jgi:hypothetical protein
VTSVSLSRLKAIWPWLREPRHAWLSLSVIALALVISLGPFASEPVIRLTGLTLQLLGIGTVAWGISETRALFGHPSFASKTKAWLARFPLLQRNVVVAVGGVALGAFTGKARAYGTHGPTTPTIESRVEALEKNVVAIHDRITQTQKEMDEEFHKSAQALKREEQLRQEEDKAIREKLEATGTGGVHISAIGASWLFVGVILSSASVELAKIVK